MGQRGVRTDRRDGAPARRSVVGVFQIWVGAVSAPTVDRRECPVPNAGHWMGAAEVVCETPSTLVVPVIDPDVRCEAPPQCLHNRPAVMRHVTRRDSPNIGRVFYTCAWPEGRRCGFFRRGPRMLKGRSRPCPRWHDEIDQYSVITFRPPLSAQRLREETRTVDPSLQTQGWQGVAQGSEAWHSLRGCRLTDPPESSARPPGR